MLGTVWVAPGDGATVDELLDVAPSYIITPGEFHKLRPFMNTKTSLALTKEPLRSYDFERIKAALDRVMSGETGSGGKPIVQLTGKDGNAYAILGTLRFAAKKAGWSEDHWLLVKKRLENGDYNHLLAVAQEEFDVR